MEIIIATLTAVGIKITSHMAAALKDIIIVIVIEALERGVEWLKRFLSIHIHNFKTL